ncbi:PTS sugar transporter subunit IIC (plasmid) [Niallia taxi]|uniref:PTS sugar transporter subunit IIC n=1 Tax=Niallia taxi TaxID=2499688 RepID=UPI002E1A2384|nr:PTS sugar transporter subunit IIC [Niallia taxi]MED4118711.1 PTS sugar transporter subunit IIC [Niallia taxi]
MMNNLLSKLESKLVPLATRISSNKPLNAIKDSMITIMPFLIVGSLFLLVAYLPIPGYSEWMISIFGEKFQSTLTKVTDATFGIIGLFTLINVAYQYAKQLDMEPIFPIMSSVMSFIILTTVTDGSFGMEWLGTKGMFVSILIALVATRLYKKFYEFGIGPKMPEGVPPGVIRSFSSLIPVGLIAAIVLAAQIGFSFTPYKDIHQFIYHIVQMPLLGLGDSLISIIIAEVIGQLLWFFGLHGNAIVNAIMDPIWLGLSAENLNAFQQGHELPHIITKQFKEIYLQMGGSGSTIALALCMTLFSKSKHLKTLGLLALPASIFNINEPIIFGLSIVLNPIMFIPWLIMTPISAVISFTAMSTGLVSATSGVIIPWTTPLFISGYLVSGVSGMVLQIVLLLVGFLIYMPFFKLLDKQLLARELEEANGSGGLKMFK